jgi:hypothetical protein
MKKKRKVIRKSKQQLNSDYAIMLEWRKCLRLAMLWMYEHFECTEQAFDEFIDMYSDYFDAAVANGDATDELDREFKEYTGIDLTKVHLEGGEISKSIKLVQAISIRVSGVILKEVYNMDRKTLRDFVYGMWDYINDYPHNSARLREFEETTGVIARLKKI